MPYARSFKKIGVSGAFMVCVVLFIPWSGSWTRQPFSTGHRTVSRVACVQLRNVTNLSV